MSIISRPDLLLVKKDLLSAALNSKNIEEYCEYSFRVLSEYIKVDSALLNFCKIKDNMTLGELKSYCFNQPQIIEEKYCRISTTDFFTPKVIANPRMVFHGPDHLIFDELYDSEFYHKHCLLFDISNTLSASARIPGHKNKYLVLYLCLAEQYQLFSEREIYFFDDVFPVLCSTYLYCFGYICDKTLVEQVTLLNRFTGSPETMKLIKLIVSNPSATGKQYAKILGGKSPNTIAAQLQRVSEKLSNDVNHNDLEPWNLKIKIIESFLFLR